MTPLKTQEDKESRTSALPSGAGAPTVPSKIQTTTAPDLRAYFASQAHFASSALLASRSGAENNGSKGAAFGSATRLQRKR
jgi:hypothetical protein